MRTPEGRRNGRAVDVADKIHSAAIRLLRSLRKVDDAIGMTAPRLSALSVLVFGGRRTLGQLAAAEQVRPPTMTRLVTALEKEGLVVRDGDRSDGRLTVIRATRKGKSLLAKGRGRRVEALAARLGSLSRDEVGELERAAELIRRVASDDDSGRN